MSTTCSCALHRLLQNSPHKTHASLDSCLCQTSSIVAPPSLHSVLLLCLLTIRMYMYVCMCVYYIRIIMYIRKYHTYHQHGIASFGNSLFHVLYISVMHSVGGAPLLQRLSWHWRPHLHVTRSGSSMAMSIMTEEWTMRSLYTSCTRSTIRKR